jgi:hypothetical protein
MAYRSGHRQVVELLNKVRTMAAHPGAYVRGMRQVRDFDLRAPEGYEVCHRNVVNACEQLSAATNREADAMRPARHDYPRRKSAVSFLVSYIHIHPGPQACTAGR